MPTALIEALHAREIERLVKLLDAGEDPNEVWKDEYDFARTPLFEAVGRSPSRASKEEIEGHLDAVVVLLRRGADVSDENEHRVLSPLLAAVRHNHIACARILLAAGADPNICGDDAETTLRDCAEFGHHAMARLLLRCGADVYLSGGYDGMNALGFAASMLDVEMVRLFLAHGADPNVPDVDRKTVLERLADFPHRSKPETPEKIERFQEIRRLLGAPD